MGYVIKPTVMRFVRPDNFSQVRDPKLVRELGKNMALVKRQGIGIIVYSEDDFSDFYVKHVLRMRGGVYTVLVKNKDEIPAIGEARVIVERGLIGGVRNRDDTFIYAPMPQPFPGVVFSSMDWNSHSKEFINYPSSKGFYFRDLVEINSKKDFQKHLSALDDYGTVFSIYEESFSAQSEYTVDYVWFVRKIILTH